MTCAALTDDAFLGGKLRLLQPAEGHRAGHDAILLAAAVSAKPGDRVADFGAGVGAAGLALASRVGVIDLVLVEIDPELAALAGENARRNHLPARAVNLDVTAVADEFAAAGLPPNSFDHVVMNPPFNNPARHQASPLRQRRLAHESHGSMLPQWLRAARPVLKPKGALTLIWRAEALDQVLSGLTTGFGGIVVLPVHTKPDQPARRVLVRAVKAARAPMTLLPGVTLNREEGAPCPAIARVLKGEATLPLATM